MARLLITGATGFVGRRVVANLRDVGHELVAVVRDAARCPAGCRPIEVDLTCPESLAPLRTGAAGCTALIHLAAAIPQTSLGDDPLPAMRSANVDTTRALARALPPSIRHIVYASTLDVYGAPTRSPITEDHRTEPSTAYGKSKREAEQFLGVFAESCGLMLTCLRLAQCYGPGEQPTKAIPRFIAMIAAGEAPVLFGDGSELRTYLYVDDAAEAFRCAVDSAVPGTFNIAGEQPISIADTLRTIIEISGKVIEPTMKDRAKPKIDMVLSTARARRDLAFIAHIDMREGLRRHYESHVAIEASQ